MTITVGIDTYISLADAKTYAAANGLTLASTDPAIEIQLKQATQAIDRIYGARFLGQKDTKEQTLAWPRNYFGSEVPRAHGEGEWPYVTVDSDGNPRDFSGLQPETGYATVELAALIQNGVNIYAQPDAALSGLRVKVATLEEDRQYKNAQGYRTDPLYKIALILRPLLRLTDGKIPLTRGA